MLENKDWIVASKDSIKENKKTSTFQNFFSPILINNFIDFKKIQNKLLFLIDNEINYTKEFDLQENLNISKSDFHNSQNFNREWFVYIEDLLIKNILKLCLDYGYHGFQLKNIWFQQYDFLSEHGWHLHGETNYSGVFYVEMPNDGPKTKFLNLTTKETFFLNMNEGQIAIFPSFALHKSPKNKNLKRKTIISFNIDFLFSNKIIN
jgi:hypothetical protein